MDNSLTGQKNKRIKVVYNLVYITWSSVISLFKVQLTPGLIDSITLYIEQYLVSKPTAYCLIPRQQNEQKTKGFNKGIESLPQTLIFLSLYLELGTKCCRP